MAGDGQAAWTQRCGRQRNARQLRAVLFCWQFDVLGQRRDAGQSVATVSDGLGELAHVWVCRQRNRRCPPSCSWERASDRAARDEVLPNKGGERALIPARALIDFLCSLARPRAVPSPSLAIVYRFRQRQAPPYYCAHSFVRPLPLVRIRILRRRKRLASLHSPMWLRHVADAPTISAQ